MGSCGPLYGDFGCVPGVVVMARPAHSSPLPAAGFICTCAPDAVPRDGRVFRLAGCAGYDLQGAVSGVHPLQPDGLQDVR